jgi:hypothetical protein
MLGVNPIPTILNGSIDVDDRSMGDGMDHRFDVCYVYGRRGTMAIDMNLDRMGHMLCMRVNAQVIEEE